MNLRNLNHSQYNPNNPKQPLKPDNAPGKTNPIPGENNPSDLPRPGPDPRQPYSYLIGTFENYHQ